MNRKDLMEYIAETYGTDPEFPWASHPDHMVFRHGINQKWFALILKLPKVRLDPEGTGDLEILNVKGDPVMIDSLKREPGFYPAYHMNKAHWISIALDGTVEDEIIRVQLEVSFELTAPKFIRPSSRR